jgi:hypothetical protein
VVSFGPVEILVLGIEDFFELGQYEFIMVDAELLLLEPLDLLGPQNLASDLLLED